MKYDYSLTDAGITGPGLEEPVPLSFLHANAEHVLLILQIVRMQGSRDELAAQRDALTADLDRSLTACVEKGEKHLDDLAMDKLMENMR